MSKFRKYLFTASLLGMASCSETHYISATIEQDEMVQQAEYGASYQFEASTSKGLQKYVIVGEKAQLEAMDRKYGPGSKVLLYDQWNGDFGTRSITLRPDQIKPQ